EPPRDHFVISYTGTIADSYQPEVFFKVMKDIITSGNDHKIEMQFIGSSAATVRSFADKYGLGDRIRFFPYVTHDEAVKRMMGSSALLLVIPEVKNNRGIITGKLFEYLASGRSIIGIGPVDGDAAKIIRECEAGEMFDRENESKLREHILRLLSLHSSGQPMRNENPNYRKFSRKELTATLRKLI
ncbi:MAG TPA: glycosyltransferase, partial [Bacteroidia bacterium]